MKKGICYGSLPNGLSDEEKFALAKRAGFHGIETHTQDTPEERQATKALAARIGIEIPSIMPSGAWETPISSTDEAKRQAGIQRFRLSIDTASDLGANTVLVVPGSVSPAQSYRDTYAQALKSVKEIAVYAEERGIQLAVENVWNRMLLTPKEMGDFIEAVGSKNVGLYFDCGNILQYGYPEMWIRELGHLIRKVHVKDYEASTRQWRYLLQGSVNWTEVRNALRDIGYDDYITAELSPYPVYPDQFVYDTSNQMDRIIAGA